MNIKLGDRMPNLYNMLASIKGGKVSFPGPKKQAISTMVHIVYCEARRDMAAIDAAHAAEIAALNATINEEGLKQEAEMSQKILPIL